MWYNADRVTKYIFSTVFIVVRVMFVFLWGQGEFVQADYANFAG